MDLIIDQVVQLQHVHHAYCHVLIERISRATVKQNCLTTRISTSSLKQLANLNFRRSVEYRRAGPAERSARLASGERAGPAELVRHNGIRGERAVYVWERGPESDYRTVSGKLRFGDLQELPDHGTDRSASSRRGFQRDEYAAVRRAECAGGGSGIRIDQLGWRASESAVRRESALVGKLSQGNFIPALGLPGVRTVRSA